MVEHEVSVETTQVETDTVRFCDYCGSPEEQVESIETLYTSNHGPRIIREDRGAMHESIEWMPPPNPGYRERLGVRGRSSDRLYVEYDTEGIAEACEACRERLGEGEIPNPGTVHRDRTDPSHGDEGVPKTLGAYRQLGSDMVSWWRRNWAWMLALAAGIYIPVLAEAGYAMLAAVIVGVGLLGIVHDIVSEVYGE